MTLWLLRRQAISRVSHPVAVRNGFICFDQATEALAEAVFVHFIQRLFVPQAATVRRELVAQHHFAFKQTGIPV